MSNADQNMEKLLNDFIDMDKKRKESEEAKKLADQASQIAKIINEDFNDFRQKFAKARAKAEPAREKKVGGRR